MKIRITHMETSFANLWYYPEDGIIHHQFLRPVEGDEFRSVLLAGLELMQQHGAKKWLSDDRNNSILHPEDSEWSQVIWLPRAYNAGWKYWAVLLPLKARGQINMDRLMAYIGEDRQVHIQCFSDPDIAWEWLAHEGTNENDAANS